MSPQTQFSGTRLHASLFPSGVAVPCCAALRQAPLLARARAPGFPTCQCPPARRRRGLGVACLPSMWKPRNDASLLPALLPSSVVRREWVDVEIRGQFIGHYMSALAFAAQSTGAACADGMARPAKGGGWPQSTMHLPCMPQPMQPTRGPTDQPPLPAGGWPCLMRGVSALRAQC